MMAVNYVTCILVAGALMGFGNPLSRTDGLGLALGMGLVNGFLRRVVPAAALQHPEERRGARVRLFAHQPDRAADRLHLPVSRDSHRLPMDRLRRLRGCQRGHEREGWFRRKIQPRAAASAADGRRGFHHGQDLQRGGQSGPLHQFPVLHLLRGASVLRHRLHCPKAAAQRLGSALRRAAGPAQLLHIPFSAQGTQRSARGGGLPHPRRGLHRAHRAGGRAAVQGAPVQRQGSPFSPSPPRWCC